LHRNTRTLEHRLFASIVLDKTQFSVVEASTSIRILAAASRLLIAVAAVEESFPRSKHPFPGVTPLYQVESGATSVFSVFVHQVPRGRSAPQRSAKLVVDAHRSNMGLAS
jgi:hypothetical protein